MNFTDAVALAGLHPTNPKENHMTDKAPRQTKSAAQRAQEAVDVLRRRLKTIQDKRLDAEKTTRELAAEASVVQSRLDYALKHPDLPAQPDDQPKTSTAAGS